MFRKLSNKLSIVLMVFMLLIFAAYTIYLVQDRTRQMHEIILEKGIASSKTGAKVLSYILEGIIDNGVFALNEVFDKKLEQIVLPERFLDAYKGVPDRELAGLTKYHYTTTLDSYLDNAILEIQDEFLKDPQIVFAVLVDSNGYLPTHNSIYSLPLTGDLASDRNQNRTKRIFDDEVGLKAARNAERPYLKQIYKRDTGEVMWDISSPVYVKGRHWGAFRIGYSMEETEKAIALLRWKLIGSMALLTLLTAFFINRVTAFTMRPLTRLHEGVEQVSRGDLSLRHEVTSNDEIGDLSNAFNKMVGDLTNYIDELKKTTATKERIESELKIAKEIQMGILPKIFPAFPERPEFDIFATIEPARDVGGDLYDFFFIDDDHLCFIIGDVSDKGVPASLFMAVTKTLIKSKAEKGLTPDGILRMINKDLSTDNDACMFVTIFLCILNVTTGEMLYSNGGHNFPYLIREGGTTELLNGAHGLAVGVVEDFAYESEKVILEKGDTFFMYTDGVTEAENVDKELFSEKRLEKEILNLRVRPIQDINHGIMEMIKAFSHDMPQSDDITMLILRFYGK